MYHFFLPAVLVCGFFFSPEGKGGMEDPFHQKRDFKKVTALMARLSESFFFFFAAVTRAIAWLIILVV